MSAPASGSVYTQRFEVAYDYPVIFSSHVLAPDNDVLSWTLQQAGVTTPQRCFVVVDAGLHDAWPSLVDELAAYAKAHPDTLELLGHAVLPGGEAAKNDPRLIDDLQANFTNVGLDRHAFVLAFGGGAVLDAVGFAAATAHRGIRLIRFPSTVLAQNDAGVGVKNGVNRFESKNALGTFAPPFAVINDSRWLTSLSRHDASAGIAEAVKVALIRDATFFAWIDAKRDELCVFEPCAQQEMIRRCAHLHLQHIRDSGDPFERGSARPLDYGHWAAHKLESLSKHELRHGQAVAIGMLLDALYAVEIGMLPVEVAQQLAELLKALGLPLWHETLGQRDRVGQYEVLVGLEDFREHLGGKLTIPMLRAIGDATEVHEMDNSILSRCIERMRQQYAQPGNHEYPDRRRATP